MTKADNSARETIFSAIRDNLGRGRLSNDASAELQARVKAHKSNLIPGRAKKSKNAGKTLNDFISRAEQSACSLNILAKPEELPEAVADYLRDNNLGGEITIAPGDFLGKLPWDRAPMVNYRAGTSEPSDLVSLTPALAAVAETGTLVMTSGADDKTGHPTALNFTPDHHLVALKSSQLCSGYEEVWQILRKSHKSSGKFQMPRSLNMITGPSRTGDIGLQIHLGAHGPRRLHILLIDDAQILDGAVLDEVVLEDSQNGASEDT